MPEGRTKVTERPSEARGRMCLARYLSLTMFILWLAKEGSSELLGTVCWAWNSSKSHKKIVLELCLSAHHSLVSLCRQCGLPNTMNTGTERIGAAFSSVFLCLMAVGDWF